MLNRLFFLTTLLIGLAGVVFSIQSSQENQNATQNQVNRNGRRFTTIERVSLDHLKKLHADQQKFASLRTEVRERSNEKDYRAILHAHAEDSKHTGGTRPELLTSAKLAGVSIIMLTDHIRPPRDFISDSWRGLKDGVLFIPGAEAEGFLAYPERSIMSEKWQSPAQFTDIVRRAGGNIFLSHIEERFNFPTENLDGLEIYNHHADLKDEGPFLRWLGDALSDPVKLNDLERAIQEYPQEFFAITQDYPGTELAKWDRDLALRPLTGVAANDCHHNQGFVITAVSSNEIELTERVDPGEPHRINVSQKPVIASLLRDRKAGDIIAKLDFDPYERSLRYVSTHILSPKLDEASVRNALRKGHAYVAHDWICDATGFYFGAHLKGKTVASMGDTAPFSADLTLEVETPAPASLRLLRNGAVIHETSSRTMSFNVKEAGVYRVEAWVELDGEHRVWIYSNPIRLTQ